jgi:colicin import membrane protein
MPMVVLSIVGHALMIMALLLTPRFSWQRSYTPKVINVSMVSLDSLTGGAPVQKPPVAKKPAKPITKPRTSVAKPAPTQNTVKLPATKPKPKTTPKPPQAVSPQQEPQTPDLSLAPSKPKPKRSLKKRTYKPSRVIKQALTRIEEDVDASRPKPVSDAIDRLKKEIDEGAPAQSASAPLGGSGGSSEGKVSAEIIAVYNAEIAYQIQKNWAFSEQLAGGRSDLETLMVISIRPDGEISSIEYNKRSGNQYLDDSAFKAVKKANPLPPLPKGYFRSEYTIGLRFTPQGLK